MTSRRTVPVLLLFSIAAVGCSQGESNEADEEEMDHSTMAAGQIYPNTPAEMVFTNDRVIVQRLSGEAGVWTGEHSHEGNQLAVVLKGGTQIVREGGEETEVVFEDGQAAWVEATEAHDHMSNDAVDAVLITLAGLSPGMGAAQAYPDAEAGVIFENDRIVVQRLDMEPNVWTGEHSHAGNQMVVVLKGGTVTYREGGEETEVTRADGESFWVDAVEAHDHANTSEEAGAAVLITFK